MKTKVTKMWDQGELPHEDCLIYSSGKMILMNCLRLISGTEIGLSVSPIAETNLDSFIEYQKESFVSIIRIGMPLLDERSGDILICGEGEMGNEGFVARESSSDRSLVWAAFFTCSNPFYKLNFSTKNEVIATSSHERNWYFPLDAPEFVVVR